MDQPMDLRFTAAQEAFRAEARVVAGRATPRRPDPCPRSTPPTGSRPTGPGSRPCTPTAGRWCRGPRSSAVAGVGILEWLIFEEEYWRAQAPLRVSQNGIFLLAPTMFEFGTDAQQERFLPPMASGREIWCQGWSEPDAGSDLAGIRSRAVRSRGRRRLAALRARRPGPRGVPSPSGASACSAPTPRPSATGA